MDNLTVEARTDWRACSHCVKNTVAYREREREGSLRSNKRQVWKPGVLRSSEADFQNGLRPRLPRYEIPDLNVHARTTSTGHDQGRATCGIEAQGGALGRHPSPVPPSHARRRLRLQGIQQDSANKDQRIHVPSSSAGSWARVFPSGNAVNMMSAFQPLRTFLASLASRCCGLSLALPPDRQIAAGPLGHDTARGRSEGHRRGRR